MNLQFKANLSGIDIFKKVIIYLIGFIIAYAAYMAMSFQTNAPGFGSTILYVLVMVGEYAIAYVFWVALIESVELGDEKFSWSGSMGRFIFINMKGLVLTSLTLGIYGAWYAKQLMNYYAENTKYQEKDFTFNGIPVVILKKVIIFFVLPLIALVLLFTFFIYTGEDSGNMMLTVIGFIIYIAGVIAIISLFTFVMYNWYINFNFGNDKITFTGEMKDTVKFLSKEFFFTVISLGIYGCAAAVTIFRYFADRIVIEGEEGKSRLKFDGLTMEGFKLVLIQTILTIITIGIYSPWAYAKCANWFISNVKVETYNELLTEY